MGQGWPIGAVFATCGWLCSIARDSPGRHNTKLDFNKLFYLAINSHQLRRLAALSAVRKNPSQNRLRDLSKISMF